MKCDWIETHQNEWTETVEAALLNDLKEKFEVEEIVKDVAWLVINSPDKLFVSFAVVQSIGGAEGECEVEILFHGKGVGSNLREGRHFYFGEDGYIFYPREDVFVAAFRALGKYFDLDF